MFLRCPSWLLFRLSSVRRKSVSYSKDPSSNTSHGLPGGPGTPRGRAWLRACVFNPVPNAFLLLRKNNERISMKFTYGLSVGNNFHDLEQPSYNILRYIGFSGAHCVEVNEDRAILAILNMYFTNK